MKHRKIPKSDRDAAIRVLINSKSVVKWAEGEARAFDVDLNTPAGKTFFEKKCREQAERLIKQAR